MPNSALDALKKATSIGPMNRAPEDALKSAKTIGPADPRDREIPIQTPEAKLRGLIAGMADIGNADTGPLQAGLKIPFLGTRLSQGLGKDVMSRAKSPILKDIAQFPEGIGSGSIASILSGVRPPTKIPGKQVPFAPVGLNPRTFPKAWEMRQAKEEFYRLSQEALDEMGVPRDASVDLFRTGTVPESNYWLTPTHVDPQVTDVMRGTPKSVLFDTPRKAIAGLVGLAQRGDEVTAGEILVPAGELKQVRQMLPENIADPERYALQDDEPWKRIPSRFKR